MVMQAMKGPVLLPAPRNLVWKGEGVQADSWCCHQGERVPEHLVRTWCQVVGTTTHMVAREAEANLRLSLDPAGSCGQAYRLTVSASGVDLQAGGPAGLFYGLMTLKQLQDPASNVVPGCVIEDGPDFTVRGVMLDVSRCKVPTLNTLFGWIDNLACWVIHVWTFCRASLGVVPHSLSPALEQFFIFPVPSSQVTAVNGEQHPGERRAQAMVVPCGWAGCRLRSKGLPFFPERPIDPTSDFRMNTHAHNKPDTS